MTLKKENPAPTFQKQRNPAMALDVQGALTRLVGRKDLYRKMLRRFGPEFGEAHTIIARSLAENDLATACRLAHNTKGVAGSIGAMALFEVASSLERAISEKSPQVGDLLDQFQAALKAACASISTWLANEE
jgi:two-component system sensor histidine kinase/response regulator